MSPLEMVQVCLVFSGLDQTSMLCSELSSHGSRPLVPGADMGAKGPNVCLYVSHKDTNMVEQSSTVPSSQSISCT